MPQLFSILCLCCLLLSGILTGKAQASPAQARAALEHSISAILGIISNPAYANPATRPPLREKVEHEVRDIFDFEEFSARTAGLGWKNFTPDQRSRFSNAFADLLLATYLDKIDGYNGEKIRYTGEVGSSDARGERVEVRTELTLKDGKSIPVAYRMLVKNGAWCVYDVLVEGVSLVKNYRTQFQDILNRGTPDELIQRVLQKAREMKREGGHA